MNDNKGLPEVPEAERIAVALENYAADCEEWESDKHSMGVVVPEECTGYFYDYLMRAAELLRAYAAQAVAARGEGWRPIETAPRDGTAVLLLVRQDAREESLRGIQFIGRHHGEFCRWGFAAPVGYGGIPDEWLEGWRELPAAPAPGESE